MCALSRNLFMENLVRSIREAAGMSQAELAHAIGKSHQSVQGYEHGRVPPAEVVEVLKAVAAKAGRADLAVALSSDEWKVRTVIHPPQEFVQHQGRTGRVPPQPLAVGPAVHREPAQQILHAMLDAVLDSANTDAVASVDHLLRFLTNATAARGEPPDQVKPGGRGKAKR